MRNSCFFWFRCPPTWKSRQRERKVQSCLRPTSLPRPPRRRPATFPRAPASARSCCPRAGPGPRPRLAPCAADACRARGPSFRGSHSVHCPSIRCKVQSACSWQPAHGPPGTSPWPLSPRMWGHPLLPLGTSRFLPTSPPQGGGFTYSLWPPRCLARESHFSTCIRGVNAVDERANGPPSSETARRQGTQAASREGRRRRPTERETGPLPRACPAAPDTRFCHGDDSLSKQTRTAMTCTVTATLSTSKNRSVTSGGAAMGGT